MEKQFLSISQAAKFSSLSERFLYKKAQDRQIRFYKIGKRIVIDIQDLIEFVKRNPVECKDWDETARELSEK